MANEAVGSGVSVATAPVGELARQDGIGRELAATTEMAEGGGGQVEEEDGGRQASLPTWWLVFLNTYNIPFSFGNGLVQQLIFLKVLSVAGVDNAPAFQGQLTLWTGLIAHINMVIVRSPHWHAAASPCSLGTCIWRLSRSCPPFPACPDSPPPTALTAAAGAGLVERRWLLRQLGRPSRHRSPPPLHRHRPRHDRDRRVVLCGCGLALDDGGDVALVQPGSKHVLDTDERHRPRPGPRAHPHRSSPRPCRLVTAA